jgi:subfamily B ATP-binding cassette protein MsbA
MGVRRLLSLVRPHWGRVAAAAFCSLVVSALNGSFAWIVKPAVDDIFVRGERSYLLMLAAFVMAAFFLKGGFEFIQNYLMNSVGGKMVRDLRSQTYRHLVYLPMKYHGRDTTGSLMSKVITDAGLLQNLLAQRMRDLFVSSGTIIVLVFVAFYRRWDLAFMAIVVLPFAFYAVGKLGRRLKRVSSEAQRKIADLTGSMTEGLTGIKIIKSFTMEGRDSERFEKKNQGYYREFMRSIRIIEATSFIMEVVAGAGIAFILYYGGSLVVSGEITSGDFFSFMAAIMMIYTPAKRLAQVNNGLQQSLAYINRIDGLLERDREPAGGFELPGMRRDIVFEDVSFRYETREEDALKDVALRIESGEVVALVGRSGSGKTTLIELLVRFYNPRKGRILIDGVGIGGVSLDSLRSQIGIVSQNVILFNDTVRENIAFGKPGASEEQIKAAAHAAFAHEFISTLPQGYDTVIGEAGGLLSGGQRQRISIARAILKDSPVLVLDEATSSLDTQSEMMVQKALDRLIAGEGGASRTILIIAHRLSTIRRADRIIVMDRGRVVETGPHEELMAMDGFYTRLYNLQYGLQDVGAGAESMDADLGL